jgi:carbamoylphosphate synthase large subunit
MYTEMCRSYKSKKEQITDIDILAIAGNKAVIIQAKSKKLTQLSKTGNVTQIKEDFREAVQKAYDQGLICREAVINKNNKLVD